jgi:hypothetical protein
MITRALFVNAKAVHVAKAFNRRDVCSDITSSDAREITLCICRATSADPREHSAACLGDQKDAYGDRTLRLGSSSEDVGTPTLPVGVIRLSVEAASS